METLKIIPRDIKKKTTKTGKTMWTISTSNESFSAWDEDLVDDLEVGKEVVVEITTKDNFKNIKRIVNDDNAKAYEKFGVDVVSDTTSKFKEAREEKNKSMYVSYTKDLFVAVYQKGSDANIVMDKCIELTKQIISAFE